MASPPLRPRLWLRYLLVAAWLLCMLSLAGWWVLFSLDQVERLVTANIDPQGDLIRYQKMLMLEGAFLFVLMIGGAVALVIFMYRERRERKRLQEFLATFTHELKTPIANVLLKAELLKEQSAELGVELPLDKFVVDLSSLTTRLENALLLATPRAPLFPERVSLSEIIERAGAHFPTLSVECHGEAFVRADVRALETIFSNILNNALQHGEATRATFTIESEDEGRVRVRCEDNGRGFRGDRSSLGSLFTRHYPGSGSGIGLYLSRKLARRLRGDLIIPPSSKGFVVEVELRASSPHATIAR